jgi:DNA-binding response OmpR family regulator
MAVERTAGPAGTERILLVEDEDEVRHLAQEILEGQGYTVLAAADATEARVLLDGCNNAIDLLLTDVVLPGVRGTDLAETLTRELPFLRVLFMSGYAGGEGGLTEFPAGTPFLAKPFRPDELASRVREVLGEGGLPKVRSGSRRRAKS